MGLHEENGRLLDGRHIAMLATLKPDGGTQTSAGVEWPRRRRTVPHRCRPPQAPQRRTRPPAGPDHQELVAVTSDPIHPYQDPTVDIDRRVEDLLQRLELEDKAGLLFHPMASFGDLDATGAFGSPSTRSILDRRITHMNVLMVPTAREIAEWHNLLQAQAAKHPLGIPITLSTDPRHHFTNNPATSFMAGPFSQWPEPLGFAALRDTETVHRFADTVRREYLAVGLRLGLHPQVDLTTDPRWARQSGTFGEDAELTARLGVAYVRGLQGDRIGPDSVSAMAKHFPGGGPQKDGEDPHFAYGREQIYPGERFDLHLQPFRAVLDAGVTQLMPYYGMPVGARLNGEPVEEVGFGFNKQIITGLLREQLGYDGVVCGDWGILSDRSWGVEHLSFEERMIKALDAGVDQFGGETATDVLIGLVRSGAVSQPRLDVSVRRLLREKFRLGLFDRREVDAARAEELVGTPGARAEGLTAQAASHVLLKNADDGPARLPLRPALRVYTENVDSTVIGDRAEVVDTPEAADVAVLRLVAPWEQRGEPGTLESFFHAGSLAWPDAEINRIRRVSSTVPTVIDVYLDRPAILAELSSAAATVLVEFGASDEAVVRVLFGDISPRGRLPFDIPSSMNAVQASSPDVPFDTAHPTFRFGDGLSYGDSTSRSDGRRS